MADSKFFLNTTTNTTEDFDLFCTKLFVGPWILTTFSVCCACVGVPAGMWLLWVLVQTQHRVSSNAYMLNLTVMDLIYNIFKLPDVLNQHIWRDISFFKFINIIEGLNYNGRPLLMACSCVDCYMAVVHPIVYRKIRQSRYRAVVCLIVRLVTLMYRLWFYFSQELVHPIFWEIPIILSVLTITFCDTAILYTLKKPDPSGRSDIHPQKQRALQTITNSFAMTLVSYLPLLLALVLGELIPLKFHEVYCHILRPSMIFSMIGSTTLPLLHLRNVGTLK